MCSERAQVNKRLMQRETFNQSRKKDGFVRRKWDKSGSQEAEKARERENNRK